jgi:Rieske Fe-S protein
MDRRDFIKICTTTAAAVAAGIGAPLAYSGVTKDFQKVKLVDADGNPLKASSLGKDDAYIFHYPFVSTPAFLISLPAAAAAGNDLKTESGESYSSTGGVGANKNVVAFVAICTHQLAHPDPSGSVLGYSAGASETANGQGAVITCCAHNSAFDPAKGANVVTGKATQPLPTIRLEHDAATDEIYATGMVGADMYEDFFKKFKKNLHKEFGIGTYKNEASGSAKAIPMSKYSAEADHC